MSILAVDFGGSAIKYGVWTENNLVEKGQFKTPESWEKLKKKLMELRIDKGKKYDFRGVAISSPGSVNLEKRQIEAVSAIPYIHYFPIFDELERSFQLPIAIENDANCAGLAEVWIGSAKDKRDVLFVVLGSGVGGAVIKDGKIHHGKHLHGGEFGYMLLDDYQTFSRLASVTELAKRVARRKGLSIETINGKDVFELAEVVQDEVAIEEVNKFYHYIAKGIYNLAYSFDPDCVVIGGGVSSKLGLIDKINEELQKIVSEVEIASFKPEICTCEFKNDANLIGAIYNFLMQQEAE